MNKGWQKLKSKISLREKVLLVIGSLVALALAEALYISHTMVLGSFAKLEEQEVRTNIERAQKSIKWELENLSSVCGNLAPWDDTRDFMLGKAPNYISSNLSVDTLAKLNLNFIIFLDTSGRIFHIEAIDTKKSVTVQVPQSLTNHILAEKSLQNMENPEECKSGLMVLNGETVLLAAQPLSNNHTEGPVTGTLVVGRYLNDSLIKTISEKMCLNISMTYYDSPAKTHDFVQADAELSKDNNIFVQILDKDNAAGYTNVYDIDGNKYITLKVAVPREIYTRGHQTVHYFMMAMALTVVIMLSALFLAMQKIVLWPIKGLTKNFLNIGSGYGGSTKLYTERGDEIGSLARSFELVMKNLKKRVFDLNDSEKRFEEVVENSGDWIWEVNAAGLYTYSSPVVEKLLGYKPSEITGKKYFYDFFHPDQREELKKVCFEYLNKRHAFKDFVNTNIHKNGKTVILEKTAKPIIDDEGNLCGYRGVDRDITERKQAEQRLLAVNELQKLLLPPAPIEQKLKSITDAIVQILDADFARVWVIRPGDRCNAGCTHAKITEGPHICRFRDKCLHLMASSGRYTHLDGKVHRRVPFGCYKIGLVASGENDKFLTNEAATDPRVHNHDWVKKLGLASFAGYRLTHFDGTPLGVLALFSKHRISQEEDALLEAIAHSTSMVIRASQTEEELRKNEEFTRRVIESSSDCIKVLDLEGRLLSMSEGGQKLLELNSIKPYLNSSFIDFWKGKERQGCIDAISKAKQGEKGIFYGYFETAKGRPKWWEVIVTPIKDADGSINRLLAVSRDITERKKAEKALEQLNKDLESTVVLLTQSNRQLSEFAHSASHDLKTPLRGINILSQWLAQDYPEKFDWRGRKLIKLLINNVGRMNRLINAIMYYSTITREKHREKPVDFNELVGIVLKELSPAPNIKITVNKDLPVVTCREGHIRQVFRHLLGNAIQFMDKQSGRIVIDYTDKKDLWEFSISDNGPGIAPQHFDRIFRLFQTLDEQNQSEGRGIGLTVVRKIVELYGGQIWLTSELGKGSTFLFTLHKTLDVTNDQKLLLARNS